MVNDAQTIKDLDRYIIHLKAERDELRAEVDRIATEGGALIIELEAEVVELRAVEEDRFKENAELKAQLEAVREYIKTHSTVNHISRTEFPSECVDGCPGCEIDEILDPGKDGG